MRPALLATLVSLLPVMASAAPPKTAVLDVQNMTCSLCPITVKKALRQVPGVTDAKVDMDKKTVSVTFDGDQATVATLVKATTHAGFPSSEHR